MSRSESESSPPQAGQPLPEPVEALFKVCRAQADAVRPVEPAMIYECRDQATCRAIAEHPEMADICRPAGDRRLVVPANRESQFRETLRVIGYAMHHAKRT